MFFFSLNDSNLNLNMLVDLGESLLFNNTMHNDIGFYHEFIKQLYACHRVLLSFTHIQQDQLCPPF